MKIQSLKCPECEANLEIEEEREFCFCQYCGCKIIIQDENKKTYRHIDEADVKRAETERIVRLKELELEEKKRENKKVLIKIWLITTGVLGILGLIGLIADIESLGLCLMLAMCVGIWGAIGLFTDMFK